MKYSLEQIWDLSRKELISILGEDFKDLQKLKTKVSIKLYNKEKLNQRGDKIVEYDDFYKIMKKASSLEEGLSKLRKCELNDYDSDEDPIDPIIIKKINETDLIYNERRCYNKKTLEQIIDNGDGNDPYTRNLISEDVRSKLNLSKYKVISGFLDLSNMNLTEIPGDLPKNLIELSLKNNKIKKIEENVFNGLSSLKRLYLNGNKIEKIEENSFNGLYSLQILYLNSNEIEKIEDNTFNGLYSLKTLILNHNKIEEIKENIFNGLSSLKKLYLSYNKIEKIEKNSFNGLYSLNQLYLSSNEIEKIEDNIFNGLSSLKILYLNHNKIEEIEENSFNGLSSLQKLDLCYNEIEKIEGNTLNRLALLH